ncbi:Protein arginine N-methyltransferase 5 [Trichinella murrelli]|uniref:Protein arginine N-methyltransferase 5 n=1 Tax=Trichinella murrelli TaxID=144512 RepID=A0A0V0U899_9BILA|nr:Protein arginine N-methyltransferase 5 [Trichinella murrelli]
MKYSTKTEDVYSLPGYLLQLENKNIDFAVIAVENPRALHSTESTTKDNCPLLSIPDIIMKTRNWSRLVVGEFPPVKYEPHEEDEIQCFIKARTMQLEYANYLGLSAMIVSFTQESLAPLAHVLNHFFLGTSLLKNEFCRSCEADIAVVPRFGLFTLGTIASGQGPGFTCRLALIVVSEIQAVHVGNASVGHCHRRERFLRFEGRCVGDSHSQYGTRRHRVGCILSLVRFVACIRSKPVACHEFVHAAFFVVVASRRGKNKKDAERLWDVASVTWVACFRLVGCKIRIWCRLPLTWNRIDETADDAWHLYHQLRTACGNDARLEVALEIGADLCDNMQILDRWTGESIGCLIIPSKVFQTSPGGDLPTVSEFHRQLLSILFARTSRAILEFDSEQLDTIPVNEYSFCVRNLYLPLQPLFEDLSAATYEVFETDSVKYMQYEMAIKEAISDKISGNDFHFILCISNVIVCGAGRGPLVTAVLKALEHFAIPAFQLIAVEKNINAVSTLDHLNKTKWNRKVHIVHSDVRKFKPPAKADIIVSEMLGSFGDNELSPECLYEAMKFLKPDGVCIPQFYQSYLSPVHAPKLHYNAAQYRKQVEYNDALECGYVVYPATAFVIDYPKPLFPFTHKSERRLTCATYINVAMLKGDGKCIVLKFRSEIDCELSGFLGYFYCILYKDHALSILPSNHTPNMRSWFSMFFPLVTPVMVKAGAEIEIHFWRNTGHGKVWYEWWLAKPTVLPVQNPNGRSWSFAFILVVMHSGGDGFHFALSVKLTHSNKVLYFKNAVPQVKAGFRVVQNATAEFPVDRIAVTFLTSHGDQFKAYGKIGDTLLDMVFNENIPLDGFGICEGTCSCSTCHVILKREQYDYLPSPREDELDMLDLAYGLTDTSRLACQIVLTEQLDGMEVVVPGFPDATQFH